MSSYIYHTIIMLFYSNIILFSSLIRVRVSMQFSPAIRSLVRH
jgi:hypothetical protein